MIKIHVMALMFLGVSTLLLGQTQGCDMSAVFKVFPMAGSDGGDEDTDQSDDDIGDSTGSTDDSDTAGEIILVAELSGGGAEHGTAEFRSGMNRMSLEVELEDAVPGSQHAVVVNGIEIGTLTIGPLGEAEVEFDTEVEPDHLPWPSAFPDGLQAGAVVQAGPTQGTLVGP